MTKQPKPRARPGQDQAALGSGQPTQANPSIILVQMVCLPHQLDRLEGRHWTQFSRGQATLITPCIRLAVRLCVRIVYNRLHVRMAAWTTSTWAACVLELQSCRVRCASDPYRRAGGLMIENQRRRPGSNFTWIVMDGLLEFWETYDHPHKVGGEKQTTFFLKK